MELFSVACITCRAKIKVRSAAAIGQVLACPRCGGMVEIVPPAGWKPPADAPLSTSPAATPSLPTTPVPTPATYVAEVVEDDPLAAAAQQAAAREVRLRRRILIGGGAAAVVIIGFALWSTFGGEGEGDEAELASATIAAPSPTLPSKPTAQPTKAAAPRVTVTPTPTPMPSATMPVVAATPRATPAPSAAPTPTASPPVVAALPMPTPSATPTAAPTATAAAAQPPVPNPPRAVVDAEAKLSQSVAGLRFEKTSRKAALRVLAELAGVPIDYDWDKLRPSDVGPDEIVTTSGEAESVSDVLEQLLAGKNLSFAADRGRILISTPRAAEPAEPTTAGATRRSAAQSKLATPITMNFRPAAPLKQVIEYLEAASGATITVDHGALAEQGSSSDVEVGIAADKHPLEQVLTALCEPREWAWRIVDPQTFEITTREALRRRPYVELYDLAPLLQEGVAAAQQAAALRRQTAEFGWSDSGGAGTMTVDEGAKTLRVRHHQAAQFRIELLIREAVAATAAAQPGVAPKPSATPSPTPTAVRPTP